MSNQIEFVSEDFTDSSDNKCSIQQASFDGHTYLSIDNQNHKVLIPGQGWVPCKIPDGVLIESRMLLNTAGVEELIEALQNWLVNSEFS